MLAALKRYKRVFDPADLPPCVHVQTSPVEFSVPPSTLEATAPTPQLGHALSQPSDHRTELTPTNKRPRAVLQSAGSGGGSANGAGAGVGASADALEAERGGHTRRRVLQDSNNGRGGAEEKARVGGKPGGEAGQADRDDVTPEQGSAVADAVKVVACDDTPRTVTNQVPVEGVAADGGGAGMVEGSGGRAAVGDAPAVVPSPGRKRAGTKKVSRRAGAAAAVEAVQQNGGMSPADAESLMAGMETPLAEPARVAGDMAAGDTAHKVTPPTIRTVRLSQVAGAPASEGVQAAAGGKTASRPRRTPAPVSGLQHRPRRLAASAAAVAVAADAADNATPSVSGGAPSTPGVRPRRPKRTAKRVQMLVEEAAHITGRTPSQLVVDDDGPPMSARAARSASRAVSKAGRESSVVEDGEEVEGGGHDAAVDSDDAEHRRRRWRRTQTGTLRTPSQLLPHIDEEDSDDRGERGL